jgi:hypothetical protein
MSIIGDHAIQMWRLGGPCKPILLAWGKPILLAWWKLVPCVLDTFRLKFIEPKDLARLLCKSLKTIDREQGEGGTSTNARLRRQMLLQEEVRSLTRIHHVKPAKSMARVPVELHLERESPAAQQLRDLLRL